MIAPTYIYRATVAHVVDGDTIDVRIDLGFNVDTRERLRLLGIDAPELSTPAGKMARDRLIEKLPEHTEVTVQTFKAPGDKYGRWLANVVMQGGQSVSDWMLGAGLAKPYDGGAKK